MLRIEAGTFIVLALATKSPLTFCLASAKLFARQRIQLALERYRPPKQTLISNVHRVKFTLLKH